MTEVWAVPGYDVQALLGFGSTGEVWRAVELATGDPVALKRLKSGADPHAVSALRRQAHVLQTLDTPYVVRLRALLGEGADTVMVLDLAAGGSLAALLARRGALDPGEVVTIAGPLAQALALLHARGLAHGEVTPRTILFTADGRPLFAGLGPAPVAVDRPDAAADLWSLGAICHHLLAGAPLQEGPGARDGRVPLGLLAPSAPQPLIAVIEQALLRDPAARPDAAAFADAVRRSHPPAPVRLGGPAAPAALARAAAPASEPAARARARPSPRTWALTGAAALVLAAAGVGWVWGHGAPPEPPSVPALAARSAPAEPPWTHVLDGLDAARAVALQDADEVRLLEVYAAGSSGLARDVAAVRRLREAGQRASGVRHTVRAVEQLTYDGRSARLRVTDELAAYTVTSDGETERVAARGPAAFRIDLVRTPQGWRLVQVEPLS